MPIYEYGCSACGERVEVIQKISDAPPKKCPACGKKTLRKLMSATAFRLKGSGWYETDFKGKAGRKNVGAADDSGGDADAKPAKADTGDTASTGDKKTDAATKEGKTTEVPKKDTKAKEAGGKKKSTKKAADAD